MTDLRIDTPTEAPPHPPTILPAPTLPSPAPDSPEEALSWLGRTVEEVAEGLRARGIKGRPDSLRSCPMARYLQTWWNHAWFDAGVYGVTAECNPCNPNPSAVIEFVRGFDNYLFPDLIAD